MPFPQPDEFHIVMGCFGEWQAQFRELDERLWWWTFRYRLLKYRRSYMTKQRGMPLCRITM